MAEKKLQLNLGSELVELAADGELVLFEDREVGSESQERLVSRVELAERFDELMRMKSPQTDEFEELKWFDIENNPEEKRSDEIKSEFDNSYSCVEAKEVGYRIFLMNKACGERPELREYIESVVPDVRARVLKGGSAEEEFVVSTWDEVEKRKFVEMVNTLASEHEAGVVRFFGGGKPEILDGELGLSLFLMMFGSDYSSQYRTPTPQKSYWKDYLVATLKISSWEESEKIDQKGKQAPQVKVLLSRLRKCSQEFKAAVRRDLEAGMEQKKQEEGWAEEGGVAWYTRLYGWLVSWLITESDEK